MTNNFIYSKLLWASALTFFHFDCYPQRSEGEIMQKISSLQIVEDEFYDAGLFPSKRIWSFSSKAVEDNTIFFTASIISTLRMIHPKLSEKSRLLVDSVINLAKPVYSKYKSRNGEVTYNFWQTDPPDLPFPNGSRLISNERARLPDDFDTTILIALSQEKNDSIDFLIRKKMTAYSRRENRDQVKLITPDKYEDSEAYEVWFGKDMPQTFDICVMSNIILYILEREFEFDKYDSATVSLINKMIQADDHLRRTSDISHHTESPALILYHVARLISLDKQGLFDSIRSKVANDLKVMLNEVENEVEKVLILSSLHRLSYEANASIDFVKLERDVKTFSFFYVNPFSLSKGKSSFLPAVEWTSEAYNWVLVLELLALKK